MVPLAPARLSTMTVPPSFAAMRAARTRASASAAPPGAYGTTIVIAPSRYAACARDARASAHAANSVRRVREKKDGIMVWSVCSGWEQGRRGLVQLEVQFLGELRVHLNLVLHLCAEA